MKPCLTDKTLKDERITLIENGKVLSDEIELVKTFNEYFSNIVSNLHIRRSPNIILHQNPVLIAMKKKLKPPKRTRNKKQVPSDVAFPFSFRKATNEIKSLYESKATQSNEIPIKAIIENYDIFATFIT